MAIAQSTADSASRLRPGDFGEPSERPGRGAFISPSGPRQTVTIVLVFPGANPNFDGSVNRPPWPTPDHPGQGSLRQRPATGPAADRHARVVEVLTRRAAPARDRSRLGLAPPTAPCALLRGLGAASA